MAEPLIHSTAIVDDGAELGVRTRLWHFTHVCAGARVGTDCTLGQNVYIGPGVRVGDRVKIQNNVSVYAGVEIGDDAFLGPSCVFTNIKPPRSFVPRGHELMSTRVERGATIGANATIVCGRLVGAYAMVGAGSVVTKDVPRHALVVGNPARRTGWVCRCGVTLPAGPRPICPDCGEPYRVVGDLCTSVRESDGYRVEIPFVDLVQQHQALLHELREALDRLCGHGQFVLGTEVERFEEQIREYLGVSHAVAVSSGTDALLMALMALNIGRGDEVITPALSFVASADVIVRVGATPVFVDVDRHTMTIDAGLASRAISPHTRAIVAVHLFGQPCSSELREVASKRDIPIVEDAAQAIGAHAADAPVGAWGKIACFSFFPTKNLGALGDGGLLTACDDALVMRLRSLRAHGASRRGRHEIIGGNFRLDAIQAAFLRVKLRHLAAWTSARRENAARYTGLLSPLDARAVTLPTAAAPGHVWNQYVIRTPLRDGLQAHLREKGIGSEMYYEQPLHLQPCFAHVGQAHGDFPEAERAANEALALPISPELHPSALERVAAEVNAFFREHGFA